MLLSGYPVYILIYLIPVILISLSFHELSHAYFSYKLGDPTAKNMGRLTLNPMKHLDPLGTLMILLVGFGWAKPVPINPMYYKNRRKGTMIVSLAGPLSNILLALLFSIPLLYISAKYGEPNIKAFDKYSIIYYTSFLFYLININLAVFNILPVPPLDGSKILSGILPQRQYFKLLQYENYIGVIFLVIIFLFPGVLQKVMSPFIWVINQAINFVAVPIVRSLL